MFRAIKRLFIWLGLMAEKSTETDAINQAVVERGIRDSKTKADIGRSLENLSTMMKSSITELQGMMGGEMGQSMQQLRQSAASGEGQMRATLDLAKEMGSGISRQQEARKMRGAALFQEYKQKMGMVQPAASTTTTAPAQPERQK